MEDEFVKSYPNYIPEVAHRGFLSLGTWCLGVVFPWRTLLTEVEHLLRTLLRFLWFSSKMLLVSLGVMLALVGVLLRFSLMFLVVLGFGEMNLLVFVHRDSKVLLFGLLSKMVDWYVFDVVCLSSGLRIFEARV